MTDRATTDRDTYVVYAATLSGGGPGGICQAVNFALIERLTDRPISFFMDVFHGDSIGANNAAIATAPKRIPFDLVAQAYFPIVTALYGSNRYIKSKQIVDFSTRAALKIINERFGSRNFLDGHLDHNVLGDALTPMLGDVTLGDSTKSLLMGCHNMDTKMPTLFGCLDPALFDASELKYADLKNGSTPTIKAILSATSLPGAFRMHHFKDEAPAAEGETPHDAYYADFASYSTPMPVYYALRRMVRKRQQTLHADSRSRASKISRRFARAFRLAVAGKPRRAARSVTMMFSGAVKKPAPKTLGTTSNVVVRGVYFGCGDLSALPFNRHSTPQAGFVDQFTYDEYRAYVASSHHVIKSEIGTLHAEMNPEVHAATGRGALTVINKSLVAPTPAEQKDLPNLDQSDGSIENQFKIYRFARDMALENLPVILDMLREITTEKRARRQITQADHDRLMTVYAATKRDDAAKILDDFIVTPENAVKVTERVLNLIAATAKHRERFMKSLKNLPTAPQQPVQKQAASGGSRFARVRALFGPLTI